MAKRVALRAGQAVQVSQERRAKLLQSGVRQFNLGLDAGRPGDAAAGRVPHQIFQQRALADPGFAAQHQGPALTGAHGPHQLIQRGALTPAAEQPLRCNWSRHLPPTAPYPPSP
jgi:hypothetical protein